MFFVFLMVAGPISAAASLIAFLYFLPTSSWADMRRGFQQARVWLALAGFLLGCLMVLVPMLYIMNYGS